MVIDGTRPRHRFATTLQSPLSSSSSSFSTSSSSSSSSSSSLHHRTWYNHALAVIASSCPHNDRTCCSKNNNQTISKKAPQQQHHRRCLSTTTTTTNTPTAMSISSRSSSTTTKCFMACSSTTSMSHSPLVARGGSFIPSSAAAAVASSVHGSIVFTVILMLLLMCGAEARAVCNSVLPLPAETIQGHASSLCRYFIRAPSQHQAVLLNFTYVAPAMHLQSVGSSSSTGDDDDDGNRNNGRQQHAPKTNEEDAATRPKQHYGKNHGAIDNNDKPGESNHELSSITNKDKDEFGNTYKPIPRGQSECLLPSISIVEVMPSGREKLLQRYCSKGHRPRPPSLKSMVRSSSPDSKQNLEQEGIVSNKSINSHLSNKNNNSHQPIHQNNSRNSYNNRSSSSSSTDLSTSDLDTGQHNVRTSSDNTYDKSSGTSDKTEPRVFQSNSHTVIITYQWEPGSQPAEPGFNCQVSYKEKQKDDCEFLCADGSCLPMSNLVCNESPDCADGSDEVGCLYAPTRTIAPVATSSSTAGW